MRTVGSSLPMRDYELKNAPDDAIKSHMSSLPMRDYEVKQKVQSLKNDEVLAPHEGL